MAEEDGFAMVIRPEGDGAWRVRNPRGIEARDQFVAFGDDEAVVVLRAAGTCRFKRAAQAEEEARDQVDRKDDFLRVDTGERGRWRWNSTISGGSAPEYRRCR